MRYIIFDESGNMLRWGNCSAKDSVKQIALKTGEYVMEGIGGFDKKVEFSLIEGVPENPKVVDMAPDRLEALEKK